jgi:hypothetical protein
MKAVVTELKALISVLAWERSVTPRKPLNKRSLTQDLNTGSSKYEATLGMVRVKRASSMSKSAFNVSTKYTFDTIHDIPQQCRYKQTNPKHQFTKCHETEHVYPLNKIIQGETGKGL